MTKNTDAELARQRAREIAAKQAKVGSNANKRWLQATIVLVVVAIVVIIGSVIITTKNNTIADAGPVPESANQYGGITLTSDGITKNTSDEPSRDVSTLYTATASHTATDGATESALPLGIEPADQAAKNGKPVHVVLFQDYNCPHCAVFEQQNGATLKKLVDEGKITLEIRNLTFLDSEYAGEYSARSANAAYSVANQVSTDKFLEWEQEMFSHQGEVLKNSEIIDIAKKYGADISADMDDNKWRPFVNIVTPESAKNGVTGTPTLYADGQQFTTTDLDSWLNNIIDTKAKS